MLIEICAGYSLLFSVEPWISAVEPLRDFSGRAAQKFQRPCRSSVSYSCSHSCIFIFSGRTAQRFQRPCRSSVSCLHDMTWLSLSGRAAHMCLTRAFSYSAAEPLTDFSGLAAQVCLSRVPARYDVRFSQWFRRAHE